MSQTTTTTTLPSICEDGGPSLNFVPFNQALAGMPKGDQAAIYLVFLGWLFVGVAIIADIFVSAIDRVTAKEKIVVNTKGRKVHVKVWNDTVANLTLMALGSSAPEILLPLIELVLGDMYSGELGPS